MKAGLNELQRWLREPVQGAEPLRHGLIGGADDEFISVLLIAAMVAVFGIVLLAWAVA